MKVKPSTVNIYLRALRASLYYLMNEGHLERFKISLIKPFATQKVPFSDEEIIRLLRKSDMKNCPFVEYRNWVAVCYLLDTENRLNTVINIKAGDVNMTEGLETNLTLFSQMYSFYFLLFSVIYQLYRLNFLLSRDWIHLDNVR